MENLLEIRGLCKQYRNFSLDHVDLTVPAGTIVGLIGENGAGKTTTIKAALHVIRPDGGTIRLLGRDPSDPEAREGAAAVFEDSYFHGSLTPRQVGRAMAGICRTWDEDLYRSRCRRFGLQERQPLKEFSRGMRMKLSLATALARHPKLLVLDEATSGLDPVVRGEMLDLFLEFIQDEGCGVLLSSHITTDLERIADQIAYLHGGKLGQGPADGGIGRPPLLRGRFGPAAGGVDSGPAARRVRPVGPGAESGRGPAAAAPRGGGPAAYR